MVRITINTDNAAFRSEDGKTDIVCQEREVLRILRKLCDSIETYEEQGLHTFCTPLMDYNGNYVGDFEMDVPREDEDDENAEKKEEEV